MMMKEGRRKQEAGRRLSAFFFFLLLSSFFLPSGCGKKGPPLAPLNLGPEAPQQIVARRLGDTVYIQMQVPSKNAVGRGAFSVNRIEVYAVTSAPGRGVPPNRDLLKPAQLVGKIPVRPPPDPDAPEPDGQEQAKDTRPKPGDIVTFAEKLTDAALVPRTITAPQKAPKEPNPSKVSAPAPATTAPAAPPPPPPGPPVLTRTYVVRGVAKNGNLGAPAARIDVPLLAAPAPARAGASPTWDESAVTISWNPPASATDEAPGVLYNVYAVPPPSATQAADGAAAPPPPLNPKPLEETSFVHPGAEPGKEQCFVVRSVAAVGTAFIESDPSSPICVTPKDTFPPAAPKSLTAVGDTGAVNLVWDANTEPDLAGYVVLRAEAPGDNMQPLMRESIRENRYVDRTVKPGVIYFYTVVALDKAGNRSAASNRVQETGR
jgi:hypothetical protein